MATKSKSTKPAKKLTAGKKVEKVPMLRRLPAS